MKIEKLPLQAEHGCIDDTDRNNQASPLGIDRLIWGCSAILMGGQSPWAALRAYHDWAFHLMISTECQVELWQRFVSTTLSLTMQSHSSQTQSAWTFQPEKSDRRFRHEGWAQWPFNIFAQTQIALEGQWRAATHGVRGLSDHTTQRIQFMGQFALNALAPVNFPWSNPEVVEAAQRTSGTNFLLGARLYAQDLARLLSGEKLKGLESFKVGETMALTPGQVVYRNRLMEIIQYAPTTEKVRAEPVLIVPAWIMKYYILDPTPENSLVQFLVAQGFTVFIISWKNPDAGMSDVSFEDYRRDGVIRALDVIGQITQGEKVHGVGYCLGGTVLAIAAAALDRDGNSPLASLTLLAAQTDFEDAGELMLFMDESQLALLEDMMRIQGFLDARQMSSAFYALRANEMVFARVVERYLLGTPVAPSDIDAWLTDPTRMPARMHSEYLRQLFVENRFAHGTYQVDGRAVALNDIRTPLFALGAERDHIAPWRSVYKVELYCSADTTFILTGGGHNSSVVSPPGKRGTYYQLRHAEAGLPYLDPDIWQANTQKREGSWWPVWVKWLEGWSRSDCIKPPSMGRPEAGLIAIEPAPGSFVFKR